MPATEEFTRRLSRTGSTLARIGSGASAAASLAGGAARAALHTARRSAFPHEDVILRVAGLAAPVEVVRDRFGVPHVLAATAEDALFGQGFVHAQDRLFQMDGMRRLAAGRLAEVAGPSAVGSDRFMRRLGLAHCARRDDEQMAADERALLEAYARGVNAGIESLPGLPPEYDVLGSAPEPWRAQDSMLLGRLLLFSFSGNWDTELLRERLLEALGPERAAALDAMYPDEGPTPTGEPPGPAATRLLEAYERAVDLGVRGGGSNAWVVSGARSATGAPLLASDPHLEVRLPGLFHVSHIAGGDIDAVGADVAGIPGVAIGHNSTLAWGLTAGMGDVADCYVERVDPNHPERYQQGEAWADASVRVEQIEVRGGPPVTERVLETGHGPVIGPALPGEDRAVALRCTALEPGDIVGAFLRMWRAGTPAAFEAAMDAWPGATFNFVFAHIEGTIGYRFVGRVPRRGEGEGLLPQDGARAVAPTTWPPEDLPRQVDPTSGALVTANNAPGGALHLGAEWCEPWRARRIEALLEARERHDVRSFEAIQADLHAEPLVRMRDLMLERGLVPDEAVRSLLSRWDGQAAPESAAAAVMETVYQEVAREAAGRLAGPAAPIVLGSGLDGIAPNSSFHYRLQGLVLERLEQPRAPWYEDEAARDRALTAALGRALETLRTQQGEAQHRWWWGGLHRIHFRHPLAAVPGLGRWWSRGPFPFGGDVNTVCQAGFSPHKGPDILGFAPAYRQVIDLADFDRSTFQLPTGNSGIPGHPRYDDSIEEYLAGTSRPILYTRAAIESAAEHRLRLEPRSSEGE